MSLLGLFVLTVVLVPSSSILIAWALIVATNNLDVAHALGVSDNLVTGLVIAGGGLVAGLVVALVSGLGGWRLLSPPFAGLVTGAAIYLGFVAFEPGEIVEIGVFALITIGLGQASAIVASTRLAGLALVAVVPAIVALGVGAAGYIQAIPAAPAEVVMVLEVYTVDETTGVCSGVEELEGVVEGSNVILLEFPEASGQATEVGSVVLPEGFEVGGGCMFELGDPLGRPAAGYANIDFFPESDPGVPYVIELEGNRVVVNLERAEEP